MITAMACQNIAASGRLFDNDCLPATNQISDAAMPPRIQCWCAKAERVPMQDFDYIRRPMTIGETSPLRSEPHNECNRLCLLKKSLS
jgi:hypothetical protein